MNRIALFSIIAFTLTFTACKKDRAEAAYMAEVSGSDYADDLYIPYKCGWSEDNNTEPRLELTGGKASFTAYESDNITFRFTSFQNFDGQQPEHQNYGDTVRIVLYRFDSGTKGDKVGETEIMCSGFSGEGTATVGW